MSTNVYAVTKLSTQGEWKIEESIEEHDNNEFILFLWKDIYLYEYMDDWEKFNETSLPKKKIFTVT